MWNLSSVDVEHAKERINRRRAELEARYTAERDALEAERAVVETLEQSAAEFARKYAGSEPAPATAPAAEPDTTAEPPPKKPAESTAAPEPEPVETIVSSDAKHGSRWRLHLGGRDADGHAGAVAAR